jgi:hypothetical protein
LPSGGKAKLYPDGRSTIREKAIDARTGETMFTSTTITGNRITSRYQNAYVASGPNNTVTHYVPVYVPQYDHYDHTFQNLLFWEMLYHHNDNNNYNNNGYYRGNTNGGNNQYVGGSNQTGGGGAITPSAPKFERKENWATYYSNLPTKYQGKMEYTSISDWLADYVVMGLIADNSPEAPGTFCSYLGSTVRWAGYCEIDNTTYEINPNTKVALAREIADTLVAFHEKKDVALHTKLTDKGLDESFKDYVLIADENDDENGHDKGYDVIAVPDQEVCHIESGTLISLSSYNNDTGKLTVKILAEPDSENQLCAEDKDVELDNVVAQQFQNALFEKIDDAMTQAKKLQIF